MFRLSAIALTLAALSVPQTADARGWTVLSLGVVNSLEECRTKGRALFNRFGATVPDSTSGDHVIAYNIRGVEIDGVVACADAGNGRVTVTLSVHTWTTDSALDQRRFEIANEMYELW